MPHNYNLTTSKLQLYMIIATLFTHIHKTKM